MAVLHFLGCGAGYCPTYGPNCAYFRAGKGLYLLDCGTSAFERLAERDAFSDVDCVTILLTHLHADHCGSLGILLDYCLDVLGIPTRLIHPEDTVLTLLRLQGVSPEAIHHAHRMGAPDENGVFVEFVPVEHAPDMRCYGLCIDAAGDRFYYSGDANRVPEAMRTALQEGRISRIYQDTASHPSAYHCFADVLAEDIPAEYRSKVFCMHLDSECRDKLTAMGFGVASVE